MKYAARLFLFVAVLFLPALALAQGLEGLPFDPGNLQASLQVLLEKMLSHDWAGLGAGVVILATYLGGKLLAPRVAFFGTGHGKVVLALATSALFGLGTLFFSTPLAGITLPLVLQVALTSLFNAFLGVGAYRTGQLVTAQKAREAAELAGQVAVEAALPAGGTRAQVVAITDRGGA